MNFKEWYEQNKEKLSQKRKEKYKNDKEYREAMKARTRYYYWTQRRIREGLTGIPNKIPIDEIVIPEKPDDKICIKIGNPEQEIEVNVYYSGTLAKMLERSDQSIRLWERRGIFPPIKLRNKLGYRLFTEDQVKVFLSNKPLLKYSTKDFENSVFAKELRKDLEKMPDGVFPKHKNEEEE